MGISGGKVGTCSKKKKTHSKHKAVEVSEDVKWDFNVLGFRVDLKGENNR